MLTHTAIGPLPAPFGEYAAGYNRPAGGFVPVVTGCPSMAAARLEAARLDRESAARELAAKAGVEHHLRGVARGFYTDEMP